MSNIWLCIPLQYLGNDLEEVRGRTVLEDDSSLELPLLSLPGVVLVPGQTLPLQLFQPNTVAMMRNLLDKDKTFGMVTVRYTHVFCLLMENEAKLYQQKLSRSHVLQGHSKMFSNAVSQKKLNK